MISLRDENDYSNLRKGSKNCEEVKKLTSQASKNGEYIVLKLINSQPRSSSKYFAEQYRNEYTEIIEKLEKRLLEWETGYGKFIVFGPEAGIGKSIESDRIIADYLNELGNRSFLIVKRFKKDVKECAEYINSVCSTNTVAVGITNENWGKFKNNLSQIEQFQVVVITHARYYNLALEANQRRHFEKGRHTLIMDELVSIPVYFFSEKTYKQILFILPELLHEAFIGVCRPVFNRINLFEPMSKNHWIHLRTLTLDLKAIDNLEKQIVANWSSIPNLNADKVRDSLIFLRLLATTECLYKRKSLAVVNHEAKFSGSTVCRHEKCLRTL